MHSMPLTVPHRAYKCYKIKLGVFPLKLVLNIISIILINIENNKTLRLVLRYLTAQLAAYCPAAARD